MSYPVIDTPTEKFLTVQKESQNTTKIRLVETSNHKYIVITLANWLYIYMWVYN